MRANEDVRKLARQHGVLLWQIADRLGIWDTDFSRKLRRELPDEEKERIRVIIEDMVAERGVLG